MCEESVYRVIIHNLIVISTPNFIKYLNVKYKI